MQQHVNARTELRAGSFQNLAYVRGLKRKDLCDFRGVEIAPIAKADDFSFAFVKLSKCPEQCVALLFAIDIALEISAVIR